MVIQDFNFHSNDLLKGITYKKGTYSKSIVIATKKQLCMSGKLYIIIKIKMQISNLIVYELNLYKVRNIKTEEIVNHSDILRYRESSICTHT
jgi:hypothetical protein